MYVNELKITKNANYNAQTNARGNTIVDLVNHKRVIEIGIIPIEDNVMKALQTALDGFNVSISFRNPQTGILEEDVNCIIPSIGVEYYTIKAEKVQYKAFKLSFTEL